MRSNRWSGPGYGRLLLVGLGLSALLVHGRELDIRARPAGDETYSVNFCARPSPDSVLGVPPHAFVGLGQRTAPGQRGFVAVGTVPGIQPKALVGFSKLIEPVPTTLDDEGYASVLQNCFSVIAGHSEFEHARRLAQAALARMSTAAPAGQVGVAYGLPAEESAKLFARVARLFTGRGMKLPPRRESEPPLAYMRRVIDQNNSVREP